MSDYTPPIMYDGTRHVCSIEGCERTSRHHPFEAGRDLGVERCCHHMDSDMQEAWRKARATGRRTAMTLAEWRESHFRRCGYRPSDRGERHE